MSDVRKSKATAKGNKMSNAIIEIEARAKAFSGEGVKINRFQVNASSEVRVWDSVAGYFTNCNSLSDAAKARIRKLADMSLVG